MNITSGRGMKGFTLRHLVIVMAMAMVLALSAGAAMAKNNDYPLTAADKISGMKNGDRALLKGYVSPQGENRYNFKDDTGTIPVLMTEIQWQAAHANFEDQVELYGKVSSESEGMIFKVRRANKPGEAAHAAAAVESSALKSTNATQTPEN